ncbi:MAG: WD40 repeat domain-containing protein [Acidobacteriota bacterium]|nr:WD40 repeat domain-containing protein [Acidobacteriota bacterium]
MIHLVLKLSSYRPLATALLCILPALTGWIAGQKRNPLITPTGFDDIVFAISFSPDGSTLAIARGAAEPSQRFGRIELWDTESGKLRHVIKGFDGPVNSISFSPDGQTLVSGSLEFRSTKIQEKSRSRDGVVLGELKWWDGQTGELKHKVTLPGEGNSNLRVSYSPDGKDLAVSESFTVWSYLYNNPTMQAPTLANPLPSFPASSRAMVYFSADMKLLDAESGELKQKVSTEQPRVLAYSPSGSLIAIAVNKEVKLLNSRTGKEERRLKGFKGRTNALTFSSNGRFLAVASTTYDNEASGHFIKIIGTSEVRLFDTRDWREVRKESEVGAVNTLAFNPSGRLLLIGGVVRNHEKEIPGFIFLDLQTGKTNYLPTGEDFTEAVDSLVIARSGSLLAFRAGSATVKMVDPQTGTVKQTLDAHSVGPDLERPVSRYLVSVKRVQAIAFFKDGKTLAAETDQGEIKLWDPRTGEVKKQLHNNQDDPSFIAVATDGNSFAEVSGGRLLLWRSTGEAKKDVPFPDGRPIEAVALSADGQALAVGIGKDVLLLASDGTVTKTLTGQSMTIASLAFSDDGHSLASISEDGKIEIWDVTSARVERTLTAGASITALRFSPNGQILATAGEDHSITLWSLQTGQAQGRLQKHEAAVNALSFSPDGQLLASGGDDRTVVIWDIVSAKSRRILKGHDQTVTSLAFSPDGRILATGSGNASVVLWEVRTGKFNRVLR